MRQRMLLHDFIYAYSEQRARRRDILLMTLARFML